MDEFESRCMQIWTWSSVSRSERVGGAGAGIVVGERNTLQTEKSKLSSMAAGTYCEAWEK